MHTIQYVTQTNTNPPSSSNSYGQNRYSISYISPSPQDVEDLKVAFELEEKVVELYLDVGRQGRENGFYTVEGGGMAGGEESGEKADDANEDARKMVEEVRVRESDKSRCSVALFLAPSPRLLLLAAPHLLTPQSLSRRSSRRPSSTSPRRRPPPTILDPSSPPRLA